MRLEVQRGSWPVQVLRRVYVVEHLPTLQDGGRGVPNGPRTAALL